MIHHRSIAASLLFAVSAMPVLAADDDKSPTDRTSPTARAQADQGKQVTLTGKIVDLHEYFTGKSDSSSSIRPGASDTTRPDATRPDTTRPDATRPDTTNRPDATRPDTSSARSGSKMGQQQYMALTNPSAASTGVGAAADSARVTSSDVIILCFADAPSVFATPRTDDDKPNATDRPGTTPKATDRPGTTPSVTDRSSTSDNSQWKDKQCQVTGTMYEKGGIKFLLVSRVQKGSDTTRPGITTPGTKLPGTDDDNK